MKFKISKILSLISLIFLIVSLIILSLPEKKVHDENKDKIKGVTITLDDSNNNDAWYDSVFPKLKNMGADLEVVTLATVDNAEDSTPVNDPNIDDKMQRLFKKAGQYGLKIELIKPHIITPDKGDAFIRSTYNPSDPKLFFEKWGEIMNYYANVCKTHNIPTLSLTCETSYLTQSKYVNDWKNIIKNCDTLDPKLRYTIALSKNEANREIDYFYKNKNSVSKHLDYVSMNLYPAVKRNIGKDVKPTDNNFVAIDNDPYGFVETISKISQLYHKDILITEIGATSASDHKNKLFINPINLNTKNPADHDDQNEWTRVALQTFLPMNQVRGVYLWNVNQPFNFLNTQTETTVKNIYRRY